MCVVEIDSGNSVALCNVETYIGGFISNEPSGCGIKMYSNGQVRKLPNTVRKTV
jgi:hypothetical protein